MTALGAEGRRFESCLPDHKSTTYGHAKGEQSGNARHGHPESLHSPHGIVPEVIAALYVETGGCYFGLPGVIVVGHGEDHADGSTTVHLDGRTYRGRLPIVAHPSCKRFGRFWHGSTRKPHQFKMGDDGGCFEHALGMARQNGGVIEHPCDSKAWELFNLNRPPRSGGWVPADMLGGWTCCVDQGHYGHPANKLTWLLVYGVDPADLPDLIWGKGEQRLHPRAACITAASSLTASSMAESRRCRTTSGRMSHGSTGTPSFRETNPMADTPNTQGSEA